MVRISNSELLKLLRKNSRTPFVDLARKLKVSETAVRKKMKKLEQDGVIQKYTLEADLRKLGYKVEAMIGVDTEPDFYMSALEELKKLEEVVCLCRSAGDHMFILQAWFKDSEELSAFVKKLKSIDGVTKICPAIILEKIK